MVNRLRWAIAFLRDVLGLDVYIEGTDYMVDGVRYYTSDEVISRANWESFLLGGECSWA